MKTKVFTLLFAAITFLPVSLLYAQGGPTGANNCVDSSMIDPNAVCPAIYAPVCGCDGITYSNDCEAYAHGVTAFIYGDCNDPNPGDSTVPDKSCVDSNLIDPNVNCPTVYDPVCGCDGITYDNDCVAQANGVISYTYGACGIWGNPGDSTKCFPPYFYYTFDSAGQTVSFMYSVYNILPDGTISGDSNNIPLGAPNGVPIPTSFSLLWDFGDGTTSTDVNPVHTYTDSASGNYMVCLTITDSIANCTAQYCEVIYNYNTPCFADFDWKYDENGDSIIFTNNTPGANDDSSLVVIWSYGDGTVAGGVVKDSTDANTGCVYPENGTYVPCLTVYDPATGCFAMVCDTIVYFKTETGIAKNEKALLNFSVFPNPANNKVFVTLPIGDNAAVKVSVVDITGKAVHQFAQQDIVNSNPRFEWNTQSVANGIYIIRVESNNASACKRVSVIH